MSTHRNIDRICIVVLVLTLILTVIFMNGERLGIKVVSDEDAESYSGSTYFTENDLDGSWADNSHTTYITLDGSDGTIKGNGAYFLNGDLVISNAGWYVITGTLEDGGIVVDAHDSSKIWIRLNGVTINCTDDACLRVDQADKVFVTLAEGTENVLTSGGSYSEEALSDNTGGAIFSHDDLTINGSGSLAITAGYKHGIDVNDSLVITGGTITITAPDDGIHVNDSFRFANATLTIDVGDDGIHSDAELYIESGVILLNSCYEGLEAVTIDVAGGDITIYPSDDGFNANGNSGATGFGGMQGGGMQGEGMGHGGFGPGGRGGGPNATPGDDTTQDISTAPNDGSTTADSTAADVGSASDNASANASTDRFGTVSADSTATAGSTAYGPGAEFAGVSPDRQDLAPSDASSDSDDEETYIRISGGSVTIINESGRDADGLDSNGSIYIDGGDIRVSLLGDGSNCAIDFGSESGGECIVTGGTIIACGGSSMAEEFSSSCTQCAVLYNLDSTMPADTMFRVLDADGNELISYAPPCSYSSVAFSIPQLQTEETYTIVCGENSYELTLDSTSMSAGNANSMGQDRQFGNMDGMTARNMTARNTGIARPADDSGISDVARTTDSFSGSDGAASTNFASLEDIDRTAWVILAASFLTLTGAILFAMKYRK